MNYLEDTPRFELAHELLDRAGKLARSRFPGGCELTFRDGQYHIECHAALAHNRVGLSIGVIVQESHCSICKEDPEDCSHITGRIYDGEECVQVITKAALQEVSLVGRPNFPDARIHSMTIGIGDLRRKLGDSLVPGTPVTCDRCLSKCSGVARPFDGSGHAASAAYHPD